MFTTKNIPSKYVESIKFDAKTAREKVVPPSGRLTHWNKLNYCNFKKNRNRKFDYFCERSFCISLMNTKSGIFTRGFSTRENTAFVVHPVK